LLSSLAQAYTEGTSFGQYARGLALRTIKIPKDITTKEAATVIVQGLTALTFVTEAHEVKKGEYVLVHAAAGGLGLLLCQICSHYGAHVIGTVSTEEKAELAKKNGAEHVVLYKDVPFEEVAEKVKQLTPGGDGVHVVFDGVGASTFESNFIALRRKGSLVSVGNASGIVPPFPPLKLCSKNIKLSRPILNNYLATKEEFQGYSTKLFDLLRNKSIRLAVYKEYPFTSQGFKNAHTDIQSRKTTGKLLIAISP